MIPPLSLQALLRESCRLHGRLLAAFWSRPALRAAGLLVALAALVLADNAGFGAADALALLPMSLAVFLAASVIGCTLLPSVRRNARRTWVEEERAAFLERNSNLLGMLSGHSRARYDAQHEVVIRLGDLLARGDAIIAPGEHLLWLYLKLLIARDKIEESGQRSPEAALLAERAAIEAELADASLTPAVHRARLQTLDLLDQRIATAALRAGRLHEIEADLVRIEHQIALVHERAVQDSSLGDAGYRVELAASALSLADDLPGGPLIAEQDAVFARNLAG